MMSSRPSAARAGKNSGCAEGTEPRANTGCAGGTEPRDNTGCARGTERGKNSGRSAGTEPRENTGCADGTKRETTQHACHPGQAPLAPGSPHSRCWKIPDRRQACVRDDTAVVPKERSQEKTAVVPQAQSRGQQNPSVIPAARRDRLILVAGRSRIAGTPASGMTPNREALDWVRYPNSPPSAHCPG